VVGRLDGLSCSLPYLIITFTGLKAQGIVFQSLTEEINANTQQGNTATSLSDKRTGSAC
jgi:uncharacterized iron-regulated membrane protein